MRSQGFQVLRLHNGRGEVLGTGYAPSGSRTRSKNDERNALHAVNLQNYKIPRFQEVEDLDSL